MQQLLCIGAEFVKKEMPTYEELAAKVAVLENGLARCERLNAASRYASAVMHEVNNPLEAIGNLVYIAKTDLTRPELMLSYLTMMEEQLAVLSNITKQTLSFHRDQIEAKDGDLVQIAESALKLYASRIAKNLVTVSKRVPETAITSCVASEILQVLSNLLLNALDALPVENAHLSIRIHQGTKDLTITVADNGSGIPEHIVPMLFQPFITGKATGTGLGLWLSDQIMAKHQGTIRYRTCRREGRSGTIYRVSLPVSAKKKAAALA